MVRIVKGVAINDATYRLNHWVTVGRENGKQVQKLVWRCPFYSVWMSMLDRCYNKKTLQKHPSYRGCIVCEEWLTFSNFKSWMEEQDWEGKQLDKDILFPGNKVYSPTTCVFVSELTNKFVEESRKGNKFPIGCSRVKRRKKKVYESYCQQFGGKRKHLGFFHTPEEAHAAWLDEKRRLSKELAQMQDDPRVAQALIDRYENYGDWSD